MHLFVYGAIIKDFEFELEFGKLQNCLGRRTEEPYRWHSPSNPHEDRCQSEIPGPEEVHKGGILHIRILQIPDRFMKTSCHRMLSIQAALLSLYVRGKSTGHRVT